MASIGHPMDEKAVETLTTTLSWNGFLLESAYRTEGVRLLRYVCHDEFGCKVTYLVALAEDCLSAEEVSRIRKSAKYQGAMPVIVGQADLHVGDEIPILSMEQFLARFGGGIRSLLPLDPRYPERLRVLGANDIPRGLEGLGTADDLFEQYVQAGLQFLLGKKVIRYGRKRSGESVPDGVFLRGRLFILYDAKAASKGYEFELETIRQFSDYVRDFRARYSERVGDPYSFLVVSGRFVDEPEALERRSQQLYAEAKVPLCFLDAEALGETTTYFAQYPTLREATNWAEVFATRFITGAVIRRIAEAARRDGIMGGER